MLILNAVLGFAETLMLPVCLYFFMSRNARTIYRARWITFLFFLVYMAGMVVLTFYVRSQLLMCLIGVGMVLVTGAACFHTSIQSLSWDALYQVVIYLCQLSAIYGIRAVTEGMPARSLLFLGNLSLGVKLLLEPLVTVLLIRMVGGKRKAPLKWKQQLCMFLLPVISLFLMLSFIEVGSLYFKLYGIGLVAFDMVLLILLNIYFVYLLGYLFRAKNLESDLQIYQIQNQLQLNHYEELERKYGESRRVIHDMKNHLQAVTGLYEKQEMEDGKEYIRDMYRMLDSLGEEYYTDNKLLNIILNEKFGKAREKGIRTEALIGSAEFGNLRDIDITTIFSNILDNAIEAAQGCEKPYISLKMDRINDFYVIKLNNSSRGQQKKSGHMGVGMDNVGRALQNYHGTVQTERREQEFLTTIMIPV